MKTLGQTNLSDFEIRSIARFLEIVATVSKRVSRPKPTSMATSNIAEGKIDKLVFKLPNNIQKDWLISRCQLLNLKIEGRYLKDKKFYLSIRSGDLVYDCLLGSPNNEEIFRVTLNPGKISKYSHLEATIINIFGEESLDSKVYRIDYTVIYKLSYLQIIEGLDVRNKQARIEHIDRRSRTGVQIGVNNDKFIIYDKSKESGGKQPLTTIERQLSGDKCFVKTLRDLRTAKDKILEFDPLGTISLNHIHFSDNKKLTERQIERLNELRTLIKHEGYFSARKKLSKDNNFKRDYGEFFSLVPYEVQPSLVLAKYIDNYFAEVMQ